MATINEDEFKLVISGEQVESLGPRCKVPCRLSPELNAVDMEIRWFKETDCVCLYKNRQVTEGRGYEGRVGLFTEELETGDVSLQLRDCRESDAGHYLCQVTSNIKTEELTVVIRMEDSKFGLIHKLVKVDRVWSEEERMKMEDSIFLTEYKAKSMLELYKTIMEQLEDCRSNLHRTQIELMDKNNQLEEMKRMLEERDQKISEMKMEATEELKKHSESEETAGSEEHLFQDMSGETPAAPLRRRNSKNVMPPNLSGECSGPDSPVSVPGAELRLVLLGRTGSGKSAAVNTILGKEERSQAATSTVTQESESRQGEVAGRPVTVVDTPDWFCPELSLEEVREDVGLCVRLSAPGPHAFLIVIPVKQSTGEERGMLEKMEEFFWEKCWKNTMILFTVNDEKDKMDIEEFIQSGNEEVQRLVEKCGNRYHCLNIKNGDCSQVSDLLKKIMEMVAGNEESFYSSEIYNEIRKMEERIIQERKKNTEQEIQKFKEKLQKELQDALKTIEEQIQDLEKRLQQHTEQISELQVLLEEEKNDEVKRKLEMELKNEIQQREDIQKELKELKERWEKKRNEMEERHKQEMEEIIEQYEGEARMEAERNLMKIILPELYRTVWVLFSKMQKQFLVKMEQKDREILMLKQKLSELTEKYRQLESDYQTALKRMADTEEQKKEEEKMAGGASSDIEQVEEIQDEVERLEGGDEETNERGEGRDQGEEAEAGGKEETRHGSEQEAGGWRQLVRRVICCRRQTYGSVETVEM